MSAPDPENTHSSPAALPPIAKIATAIEDAEWLDAPAKFTGPIADAVSAGSFGRLLRGEPLGHAAHPMLTDLPIGFWTSAVSLDLCHGRRARQEVMTLLALGTASAVPTVLTGLAEWRTTKPPESRVGSVHAVANAVGAGCFVGAWCAHRSQRRGTALLLEAAGSAATSLAGLLGGHLATVRKIGTRDPAYATDGIGPEITRPGGH
ncbi:MAG TPA: DUF2231 domain-containing protein [Flexivirga sp.]|uniref:DUF2231 domain-containing protein n=1 Tax=Flexivirga sp. TaxID=1962927 RepID=UPI002B5CF12F|nr:DUF2231 domain-containing protein [Flexivirga sp.]HWC21098.1 DUF2231 domain-containing protein [Flexivirga sp.]